MMTGYHYASVENWLQIQKAGLTLYRICKPELAPHLGADPVQGIWVWQFRLVGRSHIGSILYQMATKGSFETVLLEVVFRAESVLSAHDGRKWVELFHHGHFGTLEYHTDERAWIIKDRIPPESITECEHFRFEKAWGEK